MARRAAYRKKKQNKFGMFLVTTVVAMMLIVVLIKSIELKQKLDAYQEKERVLTEQIAEEEKRSEEIAEYEKYTHTKKYIEEVAKDKLGLIHEDEIIFREEDYVQMRQSRYLHFLSYNNHFSCTCFDKRS